MSVILFLKTSRSKVIIMEIVIKFKNWILEFALVIRLRLIAMGAFCNHPLMLCLALILFALRAGRLRGLIFIKWIFYAIILIFLGGIIVVFIYVTTLAGNEKFHMNFAPSSLVFLILGAIFIYFYSLRPTQFKKEIFISHIYFLFNHLSVFAESLLLMSELDENF